MIELRAAKKTRLDILEMTQVQESLDFMQAKEESLSSSSFSSMNLVFKEKML
jgi:hypothetical protein